MSSQIATDRDQSGSAMITSLIPAAPTTTIAMRQQRPRSGSSSCFDVGLLANHPIQKREIHSYSIHHSVATNRWIVTLARSSEPSPSYSHNQSIDDKKRCSSFGFNNEREARKFAKAYSPPKMMSKKTECFICSTVFTTKYKACHCRNCGVCVCDKCSTRWGVRMIPKTYLASGVASLTVRVCKSCDWLSNAFCLALLQGKHNDALLLHDTGNINLRCSFADIHREAMFPIHCAVMGGSLDLVKWLVEVQNCPISVKRDPKTGHKLSVQTSANRTLIDLAMTGKPKIEVLGYLVKQDLSVLDTKDPNLAPKTLQALLKAGFKFDAPGKELHESIQLVESSDGSVATIEDACVICCEKPMDCVLTPCGHQVCCSDCGSHLSSCPICKTECNVLRVFRL